MQKNDEIQKTIEQFSQLQTEEKSGTMELEKSDNSPPVDVLSKDQTEDIVVQQRLGTSESSESSESSSESKADENTTPYLIIRKSISTGTIKDTLNLTQEFYEDLKTCLEEEEEYEDEPSSPKEVILQLMSNRFESCSEESMEMNEILENVGFNSMFAENYANHIEADPLDMSLWGWINHFVVYSLDMMWMK